MRVSFGGHSLRTCLGALVLDVPRYLTRLLGTRTWIAIGNRRDELEFSAAGTGVRCPGEWSSDLHACHVFPILGRALMKRALSEHPIAQADVFREGGRKPDISFVIPHRGSERLPVLAQTIRSIMGQRDVSVECIVVEQNAVSEVTGLPDNVRYVHLPHREDASGWRKAWAFNVGVAAASSDIVVCHDGDILAPGDYAREILRRIREERYQVAHLQRFLFCLNRSDTMALTLTGKLPPWATPDRVRQNWQGGTLAILKDAFFKIGGYDERFVGWGGEDNEFFNRCLALRGWRHGYLPFVHLWHEPQPGKMRRTASTVCQAHTKSEAVTSSELPQAGRMKR